MVRGTSRGEVRPPPRRPGLLQRGGNEPSHNPRRHLRRPRAGPPRLGVLGPGSRESDEVFGWLLRGEKGDVERLQILSARTIKRFSNVGIGVHVWSVSRSRPLTRPVTQLSSGQTVKLSRTV